MSATRRTKRVPLSIRIAQAGLSWSKRQFFLISAGIGVAMFLLGLFTGGGLAVGRRRSALPAPSACRAGCCRF